MTGERELLGPAVPAQDIIREGELYAWRLPACEGRPHELVLVVRPMAGMGYLSTYRQDFAPLLYQDTWQYRRLAFAVMAALQWAQYPGQLAPLGFYR